MPSTVFVKIVGFRDVERHAINTVFRLSMDRIPSYWLWTPDAPTPAHLALIDVDSYEGGLEIASPAFNPHQKFICIGKRPPPGAWRVFERPLNWPAIVHAMDQLFTGSSGTDIDLDTGESSAPIPPLGVKLTLLFDASREHRLYLRARLSLAGLVEVDEAHTGAQALGMARQRRYDLVIVNLDVPDLDGWKLVDQLVALEPAVGAVIISTRKTSWQLQQRAEQAGVQSVLEIPFDPVQVAQTLHKV